MRETKGMRRLTAVGAILALTGVACGSNAPAKDGLSGTINGDGSSTVFPITEAVAEEFRLENPGVNVTVGVSGTGGGFEKFCAGETDFSDASRPIKQDDEVPVCRDNDVDFVELQVANDGLAVVVNTENDWATCLTVEELNKIWEPGSDVKDWSQVRDGFPNEPMTFYSPGTDSGTFDYFTDVINGEEGASRNDRLVTFSEDDNTLVTGVEGDTGAIGYFGFAYYAENAEQLNLVQVDGGDGCVTPSDETVKGGEYAPLSRPLFVYVRDEATQRPEVKAFFDFYLAIVNELLGDVGYTPLSDEQIAAEVADWEGFVGA